MKTFYLFPTILIIRVTQMLLILRTKFCNFTLTNRYQNVRICFRRKLLLRRMEKGPNKVIMQPGDLIFIQAQSARNSKVFVM